MAGRATENYQRIEGSLEFSSNACAYLKRISISFTSCENLVVARDDFVSALAIFFGKAPDKVTFSIRLDE